MPFRFAGHSIPSGRVAPSICGTWRHKRASKELKQVVKALNSGRPSLLYFYSTHCGLCKSLVSAVAETAANAEDWLGVASINSDDIDSWAFEIMHYGITYVPCFVLLDSEGKALYKTVKPSSREQMLHALQHLLAQESPGVSLSKSKVA